MTRKAFLWRCRSARLIALAVVVALSPLPALAAGPDQPVKATSIKASVARIGAAERLEAAPPAAAQAQSAPATGSPSFFKRPVGMTVLAVFAAGVGYAFYSVSHDRVHSAGKK